MSSEEFGAEGPSIGRARYSVFECCGKARLKVGSEAGRPGSLAVVVDDMTGRDCARCTGIETAAVVGNSADATLVGGPPKHCCISKISISILSTIQACEAR